MGGGREAQEGGDICIAMADSCLCTAETKTEKDTCTPMFNAALFTIARAWKQPRCLSTDEWIKKLRNICTMEYHSDIKRDASESVLMSWMTLEPIIQNEVSLKLKQISHISAYMWYPQRY